MKMQPTKLKLCKSSTGNKNNNICTHNIGDLQLPTLTPISSKFGRKHYLNAKN